MLVVAALSGCGACEFPRREFVPLPGTKGGGPGAYTVQAQMPDVQNLEREFPGPGQRRDRRQRDQDRTSGLARAGHHDDQRRRRPAGQRDSHARSDQPAGFGAYRTGAADRRPARGQAQERVADPAVVGGCLSVHRTDAGRGVAAAQRRRPGPDPGHHQGVEHRVHRPRAGPEKPDRTARQVRRLPQRPKRRHHRRNRQPEQSGRSTRRPEAGDRQGAQDSSAGA